MTKPNPKPTKPKSKAVAVRKKPTARKPAAAIAPQVRYTKEVADAICERISTGNSLRSICEASDMPSVTTVLRWLADEDKAGFRGQYVRAREAQADWMAEDILAIADEQCTMVKANKHGAHGEEGDIEVVFDPTAVARNRLRVDARKWLASKMAPKKYGDKVQAEVSGPGGAPIAQSIAVTFVASPRRNEE